MLYILMQAFLQSGALDSVNVIVPIPVHITGALSSIVTVSVGLLGQT